MLHADLAVAPADAQVRWLSAAFSSSIALVTLPTPADTLVFTARAALIRVAVTPSLSGSYTGAAGDALGMDVQVTVRKLGTLPDFLSDGTLNKAAAWLIGKLGRLK